MTKEMVDRNEMPAQQGDCKQTVSPRSGNSESIWLFRQVGSFSSVSRNHAAGSRPLSFAVPSNVWMAAARWPARSDPVNNQFFLPKAIGRMMFSTGLLSMGKRPSLAYRLKAAQRRKL